MTMDEFIEGILRCKGPARAMDQVRNSHRRRDLFVCRWRCVRSWAAWTSSSRNSRASQCGSGVLFAEAQAETSWSHQGREGEEEEVEESEARGALSGLLDSKRRCRRRWSAALSGHSLLG